jgi:hypothetical protein
MSSGLGQESQTIELIPGGTFIRVTDSNKKDFIEKKCHYIGYKAVHEQIQSLQEGFYKVIPKDWISIFNTDELEAAICGNHHIDLEDWKKHTEIKGYGPWSMTIKRFWKIMEGYT